MEDTKEGVKWAVSTHVRATYTADSAVLLDISKGVCYSLDAVASRIWATIETSPSGITLEDIVDAIETKFSASRQELENDTAQWLDKLQQMDLVHRNGLGMSSKGMRGI